MNLFTVLDGAVALTSLPRSSTQHVNTTTVPRTLRALVGISLRDLPGHPTDAPEGRLRDRDTLGTSVDDSSSPTRRTIRTQVLRIDLPPQRIVVSMPDHTLGEPDVG